MIFLSVLERLSKAYLLLLTNYSNLSPRIALFLKSNILYTSLSKVPLEGYVPVLEEPPVGEGCGVG